MSLTGLLFVLSFMSGIGLALFVHPRYGLYTYLAVFYLDPPHRWWGAFLPDLRWSLLSAVVTLIAAMRFAPSIGQGPTWNASFPARLFIVFAIWMWIQNAWALAPSEHLEASVLFTKYIILYFLVYRFLLTAGDVGNLMFVHVLGCGYLGLLAYLAPSEGRLEGVGGPGIDEANALGMFVGTGALCAAALMLCERSWKRWTCILLMPFILNTLIQSESRGAMVGVAAGAMVLFYLRPRQYRMPFYLFAAAGVVLFGYLAQDVFWERMTSLRATVDQTEELDGSAENRIVLAEAQLRMFASYPHGAGHRGTAELSPRYLDEKWLTRGPTGLEDAARSSHSTLLSALVEQGLPGITIFLALIGWLAFAILKMRRWAKVDPPIDGKVLLYGAAAAASLASLFVSGLFTDYIKTEVQVWMFAILASVVLVHLPAALAAPREGQPNAAEPARRRPGLRVQDPRARRTS